MRTYDELLEERKRLQKRLETVNKQISEMEEKGREKYRKLIENYNKPTMDFQTKLETDGK